MLVAARPQAGKNRRRIRRNTFAGIREAMFRAENDADACRSFAAAEWYDSHGLLARIIHDDSRRNRQDARRDGRAEPREAEAYLTQYVEATRGEPARLGAASRGQPCRSGVSAVAVEAFMNNAR